MLFLPLNSVYSISLLFQLLYTFCILIAILYTFIFIKTPQIDTKILLNVVALVFIFNSLFVGSFKCYELSLFFGNLMLTETSLSKYFFISAWSLLYIYLISIISKKQSLNNFLEKVIVIISLNAFIFLTFLSSNLVTLFLFLEVISILIYLYLINSVSNSYLGASITIREFANNDLLFNTIYSLIIFFWTSLASSLLLFISLILYYSFNFSFQFDILTFLFNTNLLRSNWLIIFMFISAFSIKLGFVNFFIWKPLFFRAISVEFLLFYSFYYYLWLVLVFFHILLSSFILITFYFKIILIVMISAGLWPILFQINNINNINLFLAISSALNLVFLFLIFGLKMSSICLLV